MKKRSWLLHTTVISVMLVLLFLLSILFGYFGLKSEWSHNDGWSHRPFEEFLVHNDFMVDLVSSAIYLIIILAGFWFLSYLSLLIVNRLLKPHDERKRQKCC